MEPTIPMHERFVHDSRYYKHHPTLRGALVVMRHEGALTVKRIIAVPGDIIQGKEWTVLLNNQIQAEPYIQHRNQSTDYPVLATFGPVSVPTGRYFVMGDNRDKSLDSRFLDYGLVDDSAIVGKPLYWYRIFGHPLSQAIL